MKLIKETCSTGLIFHRSWLYNEVLHVENKSLLRETIGQAWLPKEALVWKLLQEDTILLMEAAILFFIETTVYILNSHRRQAQDVWSSEQKVHCFKSQWRYSVVLRYLKDGCVTFRLKWFAFSANKINYIGHALLPGLLAVANHKIDDLCKVKIPTAKKELR